MQPDKVIQPKMRGSNMLHHPPSQFGVWLPRLQSTKWWLWGLARMCCLTVMICIGISQQGQAQTNTSVMRILLAEHNKPWSYKDQDGNILGIDAELLMYLCAQLSKTCQIRLVPLEAWPNLWNTGAADITTPHVGSRAARQTHSFRPQIWRVARSRTDHQRSTVWAVLAGTRAYDALTLRQGPNRITQVGNVTMAIELMRAGEVNALFADAYQLAQWIHNTDLGHVAELEEVSTHAIADERQTLWLHPESPLEEQKLNAVLVSNEYRRQMTTIFARYIPISPLPKGDKSRN